MQYWMIYGYSACNSHPPRFPAGCCRALLGSAAAGGRFGVQQGDKATVGPPSCPLPADYRYLQYSTGMFLVHCRSTGTGTRKPLVTIVYYGNYSWTTQYLSCSTGVKQQRRVCHSDFFLLLLYKNICNVHYSVFYIAVQVVVTKQSPSPSTSTSTTSSHTADLQFLNDVLKHFRSGICTPQYNNSPQYKNFPQKNNSPSRFVTKSEHALYCTGTGISKYKNSKNKINSQQIIGELVFRRLHPLPPHPHNPLSLRFTPPLRRNTYDRYRMNHDKTDADAAAADTMQSMRV